MLETVIASFMLDRELVPLGFEVIAELLGRSDRHYIQRALNESAAWQQRSNVRLCDVRRGERNVRRPTEFSSNRLNDAAIWISQKQPRSMPDVDELVEESIVRFLRRPLAVVKQPSKPITQKTPTTDEKIPNNVFATAANALIARQPNFLVFPVDIALKKPLITLWKQNATRNPNVIAKWAKKWPDAGPGVATGRPIAGGGFLTVLDKDRHATTFGDGFKTVALREEDLGPLPTTFTVTTAGSGEHSYFRTTIPLPTRRAGLGPELDCKSRWGFVVGPGSYGYTISHDLPIAWLPQEWEQALSEYQTPREKIPEGKRHEYLRAVSYAMACHGKQVAEILTTLRHCLIFNCEQNCDRTISDGELQALASSAVAKVSRADEMLRVIVA